MRVVFESVFCKRLRTRLGTQFIHRHQLIKFREHHSLSRFDFGAVKPGGKNACLAVAWLNS